MLTLSEEELSLQEGEWVAFTLRTTPPRDRQVRGSVNYHILFLIVRPITGSLKEYSTMPQTKPPVGLNGRHEHSGNSRVEGTFGSL
jgi:hypothetical protein